MITHEKTWLGVNANGIFNLLLLVFKQAFNLIKQFIMCVEQKSRCRRTWRRYHQAQFFASFHAQGSETEKAGLSQYLKCIKFLVVLFLKVRRNVFVNKAVWLFVFCSNGTGLTEEERQYFISTWADTGCRKNYAKLNCSALFHLVPGWKLFYRANPLFLKFFSEIDTSQPSWQISANDWDFSKAFSAKLLRRSSKPL